MHYSLSFLDHQLHPKSTNMNFYKQCYLHDGMLILDLTESFNTENA